MFLLHAGQRLSAVVTCWALLSPAAHTRPVSESSTKLQGCFIRREERYSRSSGLMWPRCPPGSYPVGLAVSREKMSWINE